MASMPDQLTVSFEWEDPKQVRALRALVNSLEELSDMVPWNPAAKRAHKAARYLLKNMTCRAKQKPASVEGDG